MYVLLNGSFDVCMDPFIIFLFLKTGLDDRQKIVANKIPDGHIKKIDKLI
jgi:hypothetical protein